MSELLKEISKIKLRNKNLIDTARPKMISCAVYNSGAYGPACYHSDKLPFFYSWRLNAYSLAVLFSRLLQIRNYVATLFSSASTSDTK